MPEAAETTVSPFGPRIWIVAAFFAGAYLGAIAFAAVAAWRDSHPLRRGRDAPPPPVRLWDMEPRTVTHY